MSRHERRFPILVLALAALLGAPAAALAAPEAWEREFAQNMSSTDSNLQYLAVTKLDPGVPRARDLLYGVLGGGSWYLRQGAIDTLLKAPSDALEDIRKAAKTHKSPAVREGLALAFGQMKDKERVADLIEALEDKHPDVRRAAVYGIMETPTKEGVSAIVAAWKKEKDWTVKVYYKTALEKLTRNYFGWVIEDWEGWWLAKQDKWKPPKPKKEKKPGEEQKPGEGEEKDDEEETGGEGKEKPAEETTTLRDVDLTIKESGKGGPLFVLPALYRNKVYLENHMQALEDSARLFYIDLPPISNFRGLKNLGKSGMPEYPLDLVCDAFDQLRKDRKQEKIAIMGHEMAAWVGMRYATKYPDKVSHLILISTYSGEKAWSDAITRVEKDGLAKKNPEQEHYAKNIRSNPDTGKHDYEPKDPQEEEALHRMGWSLWFGDPKSYFAQMWYKSSFAPIGGCYAPKFELVKEKPNPVPTLIFHGSRSLWTSEADAKSLSKCYPNASVIECKSSAELPFIDDHELFVKAVKGFFKKNPFPKKKP